MSSAPFALLCYHYRCQVGRVYDGDTLMDVFVDLGMDVHRKPKHGLRLLRLNTFELNDRDPIKKALAQQGKAFTVAWLAEHASHLFGSVSEAWPFVIRSAKGDSFDRPLVEFQCGAGHSLNDDLLSSGLAVPFRS